MTSSNIQAVTRPKETQKPLSTPSANRKVKTATVPFKIPTRGWASSGRKGSTQQTSGWRGCKFISPENCFNTSPRRAAKVRRKRPAAHRLLATHWCSMASFGKAPVPLVSQTTTYCRGKLQLEMPEGWRKARKLWYNMPTYLRCNNFEDLLVFLICIYLKINYQNRICAITNFKHHNGDNCIFAEKHPTGRTYGTCLLSNYSGYVAEKWSTFIAEHTLTFRCTRMKIHTCVCTI